MRPRQIAVGQGKTHSTCVSGAMHSDAFRFPLRLPLSLSIEFTSLRP